MQVDATEQPTLGTKSLDLVLNCEYLGLKLFDRSFPTSIEVESNQVTSEIAIYDTINVDHGEDPELIFGKQVFYLGCLIIGQHMEYLFHYE